MTPDPFTDYIDRIQNNIHSFDFPAHLSPDKLHSVVTKLFSTEDSPFWGDPIWLSQTKAHIYGIDMADYTEVSCEIDTTGATIITADDNPTSADRFRTAINAILPKPPT